MSTTLIPKDVPVSKLLEAGFSSRNFAEVNILRGARRKLSDFLLADRPFDKGVEPGSSSYVPLSNTGFLRNSCINLSCITPDQDKLLFLNPKLQLESMAKSGDILLCKDANIGDAALLMDVDHEYLCYSSGIVRLNFKDPKEKFFALAAFRDEYFADQLYALTPRGSTIRHAGDKFLECELPALQSNETWVLEVFASLMQNAARAEMLCRSKLSEGVEAIREELLISDTKFAHPSVKNLLDSQRMDAGFFSKIVQNLRENLEAYPHGHMSLQEAGFSIRRGPNLAKRDLGRSIICDEFRPNYDVLIYPSDISNSGFLLRNSYIGARGAIWHLGMGDILFSAEGTVGRVFAVFDDSMKFTTNFHGIIISSNSGTTVEDAATFSMYLHFLREIGWFSKVSVGGQGGSFASSYWHLVRLPRFPAPLKKQLAALAHRPDGCVKPFAYDENELEKAGLYQLSKLRLQCTAAAKRIMGDLKNDTLNARDFYESMFSTENE